MVAIICTSPRHQLLEHLMATAFTSSLESHVASHILTHSPHPQTLGFTTFLEPSSLEYHNLLHLSSPQSLGVTNSLLPHQSCCMNVVCCLPPSLKPHPNLCTVDTRAAVRSGVAAVGRVSRVRISGERNVMSVGKRQINAGKELIGLGPTMQRRRGDITAASHWRLLV